MKFKLWTLEQLSENRITENSELSNFMNPLSRLRVLCAGWEEELKFSGASDRNIWFACIWRKAKKREVRGQTEGKKAEEEKEWVEEKNVPVFILANQCVRKGWICLFLIKTFDGAATEHIYRTESSWQSAGIEKR